MKKIFTVCVFTILCITAAHAQYGLGGLGAHSKKAVVDGDASVLKGEKISVSFTYDNMGVGKETEEEYLKTRIAQKNEKEPGSGDKWAKEWKDNREKKYQPAFIEKFNQMGNGSGTQVTTGAGSYKLVIKTTNSDPGYNIGMDKSPARINTICEFSDNSGKVILTINLDKVPGQTATMMGDFAVGTRLAECYEKLGKDLYNTLAKSF